MPAYAICRNCKHKIISYEGEYMGVLLAGWDWYHFTRAYTSRRPYKTKRCYADHEKCKCTKPQPMGWAYSKRRKRWIISLRKYRSG